MLVERLDFPDKLRGFEDSRLNLGKSAEILDLVWG